MLMPVVWLAAFVLLVSASEEEEISNWTLDLCDNDMLEQKNITAYKYRNNTLTNCDCLGYNCIRKCCAYGYIFAKGYCEKSNNSLEPFSIDVYDMEQFQRKIFGRDKFSLGVMNDCDFYPLSPSLTEDDNFYVQEDGHMWIPLYQRFWTREEYCLDEYEDFGLSAIICFGPEPLRDKLYRSGMIVSMPFLLVTFIVYALLPERNLHMKALMSYVFTLFLAYALLVSVQMSPVLDLVPCSLLGYFCLFFFIVSFYWMNVICIDIYLGFSGIRGFSGKRSSEKRRFLIYCAYAWGMSVAHVIVVLIIDQTAKKNAWYNPGMGNGQCYLRNRHPQLLYFYLPVGVLITVNITLFALTAFKIRRVKQDTKMLKKNDSQKHNYENDKQQFNLYLKLLFAMGVNWSMEIISWAVNWSLGYESEYVWYATDFCNAVYGVVIFFIFVFKKSIWRMLKKRYYSFIGKPHLAHSMTTTQTRSTSYSTAQSTVHELQPTSNGTGDHMG